jgi:exonuclease III
MDNQYNHLHNYHAHSFIIPSPNLTQQQNNTYKKYKKRKFHPLSDIMNIATLNIQHLTEIKQQSLIDIMKRKHIEIMGLSETNITNKQSKYLYHHEKANYTFYFNNEVPNKGKGVGLIIHNNYARFIYNHKSYKGRIIYVDFSFKGKYKLRIIQYYGKSGNFYNSEIKKEVIDLQTKLIEIINEAKSTQHEVVVMGNFNQHYENTSIENYNIKN